MNMSIRNEPPWKLVEISISALILLTALVLLAGPQEWYYGPDFPLQVVIASAIGFWVAPAMLGVLALYHAWRLGLGIRSVIFAGLAALTLLVLLMNFHTTATSPGGLLRYEGRGAFYGPFVSLFTGCLLAIAILISAFEDRAGRE